MEATEMVKWLKANWLITIGFLITMGLGWFAIGCTPKTRSLINYGEQVTRDELKCEIDYLLLKSESRIADLNRQEEIRSMIFEQGLLLAQGNSVTPGGITTTLLAILGVFSTADSVRLRKKIKKLPTV